MGLGLWCSGWEVGVVELGSGLELWLWLWLVMGLGLGLGLAGFTWSGNGSGGGGGAARGGECTETRACEVAGEQHAGKFHHRRR